MEIPKQNCLRCGKDTGTHIMCEDCRPLLSPTQKQRFDKIYRRTIIELYDNSCIDCGHSAETESGELAADHLLTKGSRPDLRYCLGNSLPRCIACHNKRHTGEISILPSNKKMPKQTKKYTKLPWCSVKGCTLMAVLNGKCFLHRKK